MKGIHFDAASSDTLCNILEALGFPSHMEEVLDWYLDQLQDVNLAIVRSDPINNGLQAHYDSSQRLFAPMTRNGFQLRLPVKDIELITVEVFMTRQEDIGVASFRIWIRFSYDNAFKEIGKVCSMLRDFDHFGGKDAMVSFDKPEAELMSIKAVAAICACWVAGAHGGVEILTDMARDRVI